MSFAAEHLAWKQRLQQEYKAQSSSQETHKLLEQSSQGKYVRYPELLDQQVIDLLNSIDCSLKLKQNLSQGVQKDARAFGQNFNMAGEIGSQILTSSNNKLLALPHYDNAYEDLSLASNPTTRTDVLQRLRQSSHKSIHQSTGAIIAASEIKTPSGDRSSSKVIYQRGLEKRRQSSKNDVQTRRSFQQSPEPYLSVQETFYDSNCLSRASVQRFNEVLSAKGSHVSRDRPRQLSISQKSGSVFSKERQSMRSKRLSEIMNDEVGSLAKSKAPSVAASRYSISRHLPCYGCSIFKKKPLENIKVLDHSSQHSKKTEADQLAHQRALKTGELKQLQAERKELEKRIDEQKTLNERQEDILDQRRTGLKNDEEALGLLEDSAEEVQETPMPDELVHNSSAGDALEDVKSLAPSVSSKVPDALPVLSHFSKMSGKTYISMLHRKLEEERQARLRLEKELLELRQASQQINSNIDQIRKDQEQMKEDK